MPDLAIGLRVDVCFGVEYHSFAKFQVHYVLAGLFDDVGAAGAWDCWVGQ